MAVSELSFVEDKTEIRVLLIDDDQEDYFLIRDLAKNIGMLKISLDWQPNLDLAQEWMKSSSHDIYLIDDHLSSKSGLELFQEVKDLGFKKPVIFLTGSRDSDLDHAVMVAGASDYLTKSTLSSEALERSLRYLINRETIAELLLNQEKLLSIGLISSGVAHDIGTPLTVIRMHVDYLMDLLKDNPPVHESLNVVLKQIDLIAASVRSLSSQARDGTSEQ